MERSHYGPTLMCCLLSSAGLCCAIFPYIPPTPRFGSLMRLELSFIITRCFLITLAYFVQLHAIAFVLKRKQFHRDQKVFWPLQCKHCAKTLGISSSDKCFENECADDDRCKNTTLARDQREVSQDEHKDSMPCLRIPENALPVWARYEDESEPSCSRRSILNPSTSLTDLSTLLADKQDMVSRNLGTVGLSAESEESAPSVSKDHHKNKLFTEPDRSLLVVFNILGVVSLLNIPMQLLRVVKCLEDVELSGMVQTSTIVRLVLHLSFITLIVCTLIFFNTYHGAAFLNEAVPNRFFGIIFAFCFWVAAIKIVVPISDSLNEAHDPCELSGSLEQFLYKHNKILSKIDAECGIIGAGIIWEMWKSVIPHRFLHVDAGKANFVPFFKGQVSPSWTICKSWTRDLRSVTRRIDKGYVQQTHDPEALHQIEPSRRHSSLPLVLMLFSSFIFGVILIAVTVILPRVTVQSTLYMDWCLEIACVNPLIGLIFYQSFLTSSSRILPVKDHLPQHYETLQGHEIILIVSCTSSFLLSLFRIGCSIAVITYTPHLSSDEIVLASYSIVHGLFVIFHLWVTTRFLLVVQRQVLRGPAVVKWTKVCLVYVVIVNGVIWFIGVVGINTTEGYEFRIYYGKPMGKFLREIFDPLVYLFPLHAAIIAYENYKTITGRSTGN